MSKPGFFDGAVYVRDYILASIIGIQNEMGHSNPNDQEYKAYQDMYELIVNKFGDMFTNFKG